MTGVKMIAAGVVWVASLAVAALTTFTVIVWWTVADRLGDR